MYDSLFEHPLGCAPVKGARFRKSSLNLYTFLYDEKGKKTDEKIID
jgi:hypothetical protein